MKILGAREWLILSMLVAGVGCSSNSVVGAGPTLEGGSLSWMEGHWVSAETGASELWSARAGGLVGFSLTPKKEGEPSVELMRMTTKELVAAPRGQEVTTFRMVDQGPSTALFENRRHDFPKWVRYDRVGTTLTASIGVEANDAKATWSYQPSSKQVVEKELEASICSNGGGVRIELGSCSTCGGALYCAELGGELIVGITDRNCDGCTETSGVCHTKVTTPASSGCEQKRIRAFVVTGDR